MKDSERGYVALISVFILSFLLLIAVFSLAQFGILSRFFLIDLENKSESEQLAAGCVQVAIIAVVNDPKYEVTAISIPVGKGSCTLVSVDSDTPSIGLSRIKTSAEVSGATTNIEVVWDHASEEIDSWKEVPGP